MSSPLSVCHDIFIGVVLLHFWRPILLQKFGKIPYVIGDPCFHCGRSQRTFQALPQVHRRPANGASGVKWEQHLSGRLAQLGEHGVRNAGVVGSNPMPSTKKPVESTLYGRPFFVYQICTKNGAHQGRNSLLPEA